MLNISKVKLSETYNYSQVIILTWKFLSCHSVIKYSTSNIKGHLSIELGRLLLDLPLS